MSQKQYPVRCECGREFRLPASAAGTAVACECGRAVEVPSLGALKAAAGEPAASADLEIGWLLQTRQLPFETDCAICLRPTDHTFACVVRCEQATLRPALPWWQMLAAFAIHPLNLATFIWPQAGAGDVLGRDVVFRLPIRMCEPCTDALDSWDTVRTALRRTPVYDRLLRKYPRAELSKEM